MQRTNAIVLGGNQRAEIEYLVSGVWKREEDDNDGQPELAWVQLRELRGIRGYQNKIKAFTDGLARALAEAEAALDDEEEGEEEDDEEEGDYWLLC